MGGHSTMKLWVVAFVLVLASVEGRRRPPKGPPRPPKGPPSPPPSGGPPTVAPPSGPPSGPPGGNPGGNPGGTIGSCPAGQADASQCGAAPEMLDLDLKQDVLSASAGGGATTGSCGDSARPFYQTFVEGDSRYVVASGVPAHAAECGQQHVNPNVRCERWQWVKLPLEWSDAGSQTMTMGTTGYVSSGAVVFDHRSSPFGDLASCHEWASLDPSHGHSAQGGAYHYHAVPTAWEDAADPSACQMIGYMRDGGELYGLCNKKSCYQLKEGLTEGQTESDYDFVASEDCHLDECNMGEMDGKRAYFMSDTYPFVPPCMKGDVQTVRALGFVP